MDICSTNNINVSIPTRLVEAGYRFIKVAPRDKKAVEIGWNKTKNYSHESPEIVGWLEKGGNYGVLGSPDYIIIDTDNETLAALLSQLPDTFTVRSGSGRGLHVYFKCKNDGNLLLVNPADPSDNWGNVQASGKFVVGPGSIHPSGGKYEVVKDVPVAEVSIEEIKRVFEPYIRKKRQLESDDVRKYYGLYTDVFDTVSLADVGCYPVKPVDRGNGEIQGEHPLHGSTGGMNFAINTRKNLWHCYRDDSGGGPLEWLAVSEGVISCDEAGAGCLRGEKFVRVLEIAKEKGIKISLPKKLPPPRPKILDDESPRKPTPPPSTPPVEPTQPPLPPEDDPLNEWKTGGGSAPEPLPVPPEPRITHSTVLPEAIPDADVVLIDAPPRLGKTHRIVTWAAQQCHNANIITTSHSIVGQQLRIFREHKTPDSTAVHLEGKDRCCLKKEREKCKLCEYYPFDGENFLDIKQYVKDLITQKKILTKENVNEHTGITYCPYYIIKLAEPFANYCFTVVANVDRVTARDYTFIDEDPSISHFFANSVELLEASFHTSHASATSKLEERWIGIEKYKKYLSEHRHEGKKVLTRVIEILEQFRAVLNVENMNRATKQSLIQELSQVDTTLPDLGDLEPHELIDHVKKFELPDTFSPYVEALLFQYTPQKFIWSGANPSTLHLVAIGDELIRPAPEGKLVVIGSTRAELFVKALGRDYKVVRIPQFNYSDWFGVLVIREETKKSGRKLMEQVLKKLSRTNEIHRYPLLVLTGSEKDQKRLKSVLGGIAHCSSDENQIGQLWNKRGGYTNIFYQNSVISRGIDVDFYNMLFVYSSDFANPYWNARLLVARENRDIEEAEFVQQVIDAIVIDETTNSMLRISPVRSTQDSFPRVVVICDTDLWKVKPAVLEGMNLIPVDADFFDSRGWTRILNERKIGLYDIWQDPAIMKPEIHDQIKPDMGMFERVVKDIDLAESMDWRRAYNKSHLDKIEEDIRAYLKKQQVKGNRSSELSISNYITNHIPSNMKSTCKLEIVLLVIRDMVRSGEVIRELENNKSLLSLRERYVPPVIEDGGQFSI